MGVQDHLRVDVALEESRAVVSLDGELDMASAPLLANAVEYAEVASSTSVVLDLHQLEFIDSTGLRIILLARARCRERGQQLTVTRGSPQVERLLNVTGMTAHLRTAAGSGGPNA